MNWELKRKITEKYHHQWEFAREVGTCETIVSRVVNGRRQLGPEQQKKWADALGCKVKNIFG